MIIEFLGVSGVGKTTLAEKYYNELIASKEEVEWFTYKLYKDNSWFKRNIMKASSIFFFLRKNKKWSREYKEFIDSNVSNINEQFKLWFNGCYLKANLQKALYKEKKYIFDEGTAQYLWAILLRNKKEVTIEDFKRFYSFFSYPDIIYVVSAKPEIIKSRLISRGEKTKILESDNLLENIDKMRLVQKKILCFFDKKEVKIICIDNNIKKNFESNKIIEKQV